MASYYGNKVYVAKGDEIYVNEDQKAKVVDIDDTTVWLDQEGYKWDEDRVIAIETHAYWHGYHDRAQEVMQKTRETFDYIFGKGGL